MWTTVAAVALLLAPPVAPATPAPSTVCTIDVRRLVELSGLVSTAAGYVAINDGQDDSDDIRVFYLNGKCGLTRSVPYPTAARDPEDLARAPDGTLWVADIGDNFDQPDDKRRETIALWRLPADGSAPVIHRLAYPDGPHDAEALVFAGDGTPVIVTKEPLSPASIYVPTSGLKARETVPLEKVGEFRPKSTGTEGFGGLLGQLLVTGGTNSRDGKRVALRTYSDAYEWDVPDGDVVKAITTGTPRITALPEEPQGEAIAYSYDGRSLLTASDEDGPTKLRRYPASAVPSPSSRAAERGLPLVSDGPDTWVFALGLGFASVGLAVLLAGALALGLRRRDRRPRHR